MDGLIVVLNGLVDGALHGISVVLAGEIVGEHHRLLVIDSGRLVGDELLSADIVGRTGTQGIKATKVIVV